MKLLINVEALEQGLRELTRSVQLLCSVGSELRHLEALRLAAPERHHLGDSSVRQLSEAMKCWPKMRTLELWGAKNLRLSLRRLSESLKRRKAWAERGGAL